MSCCITPSYHASCGMTLSHSLALNAFTNISSSSAVHRFTIVSATCISCFGRHPTFEGRYTPTNKQLKQHHRALGIRVWMAKQLLQLTGRGKQAAALYKGFKSFQVQNTPGWALCFNLANT